MSMVLYPASVVPLAGAGGGAANAAPLNNTNVQTIAHATVILLLVISVSSKESFS
jgi:hypothetical protein